MIDTTQGAGEKAGLLSENGDRAHLLSAGGADEFQQSAKGQSEQASRRGARQSNQPLSKDSFMTGSRQSVGMAPDPGNFEQEADMVASDSEGEVGVPAVMDFQKQEQLPKAGFSTFEEADAFAEKQSAAADAYGLGGNTNKSNFRNSKPNDGFARVTWTDLASGRNTSGPKVSGRKGGFMKVAPETSAFTLAN